MIDNPDRIFLEPDHAQIEGRMWCIDNDPASLGEHWTEYVRADLYAARTAELANMREDRDEHFAGLVKCAERITELTADRDRWMSNAHGAQKLSLEYLRERDHYREALEKERARVRMLMARHEKTGELEVSGHAHQLLKIMDKHVTDALNREE